MRSGLPVKIESNAEGKSYHRSGGLGEEKEEEEGTLLEEETRRRRKRMRRPGLPGPQGCYFFVDGNPAREARVRMNVQMSKGGGMCHLILFFRGEILKGIHIEKSTAAS